MSAAYDYDITEVMQNPPLVAPEQFADAQAMLATSNPDASDFDIKSILDNSFVKSAAARGLGGTN